MMVTDWHYSRATTQSATLGSDDGEIYCGLTSRFLPFALFRVGTTNFS
jgi:hypothetical protein